MGLQQSNITRHVPRLSLSRSEVALAIGVSPSSVDQMVSEGRLPRPRVWHTRKVWLVSEIESYLHDWPQDGHASKGFFDGIVA